MSEFTEALKSVHGLSKLVNNKLFKDIQFIGAKLDALDNYEAMASAANAKKDAAETAAKAAEEKLTTLQNALTKAEEAVHAKESELPEAKRRVESEVKAIIVKAQNDANAIVSEAGVKAEAIKKQVEAGHSELASVNDEVGKAKGKLSQVESQIEELKKVAKNIIG